MLVFWILCGIGAVVVGICKGASPFSIFTGYLFGPIGLLAALLARSEKKDCPYCKEKIKREAIICKHCKKELTTPSPFEETKTKESEIREVKPEEESTKSIRQKYADRITMPHI